MIGGIVIGITRSPNLETRVNVQGTGCECNDTRQVVLVEGDHRINLDDFLWWQCGFAYWTPKFHGETESGSHDIKLEMKWHS